MIDERWNRKWLSVLGFLIAGWSASAIAQTPVLTEPTEHALIYEVGWAADWSRREGFRASGGTFAVEVTPIERWLEIELGGTAIRSTSTELSVDLLFKKPWSIFRRVEFMAGAGPQLVHDETGAHAGWSAVGDLMVWPTRHVGWYVEPGYEAVFFPGGARRGFTIAAGLLLGH